MKTYLGIRNHAGCAVLVVHRERRRPLNPRFDRVRHSPDGFEWGYGGSGPSQLAFALLADCLGDDELALALYHEFKWAVIARIEEDAWELTEADVRVHLAALGREVSA